MYYPYLRARQFELIALRELALRGVLQGFVCPILEPIRETLNNLNIAVRVFEETNQNVYFIVNPLIGEVQGDGEYYLQLLNKINSRIVKVAFHYRSNSEYILSSIKQFNLEDVLIICSTDVTIDDEPFRELVHSEAVSATCAAAPEKNRALHRFLKGLNKIYIRLDDLFEKQQKNSDFLDITEHRFSEEHLYYKDEGFTGFSDYTVLPSEYVEGGSMPRAVVIHLTFLKNGGQIWIRHFTSNTNDSIANVQGKFAEACYKAISFCAASNIFNLAIKELEDYYKTEHYPGLGTVKKVSIKNHLLVVAQFLSNL